MFKGKCLLLAVVLLLPISASAAGTTVKNRTTWNGITRFYAVYIPQQMPVNAPMVVFLHGTQNGNPDNPPWLQQPAEWKNLADKNKFLMVWPVSTFNTRSNQWYWDCNFFDFSFTAAPDDVGYLRNLITTLAKQFQTDPKRVFVSGMSSGGYMTQRVGVELSDLVAAIAPVSGTMWVQPDSDDQSPATPAQPVSVLEYHGTVDPDVPYCGGSKRLAWKETNNTVASTQDTLSYWVSANACSRRSTTQPTCIGNKANAAFTGLDATGCLNGVEVKFIPEVGVGHVWVHGTGTPIWKFFSTHGR